jgi:hypothetical protein
MRTLTFAAHTAYIDPMTGEGLLVRPRPELDLGFGFPSLHAADWGAAIAHLSWLGWEPMEDDDGSPMLAGITADGRDIIGLYGRESITSLPSITELRDAGAELASMAGLTL